MSFFAHPSGSPSRFTVSFVRYFTIFSKYFIHRLFQFLTNIMKWLCWLLHWLSVGQFLYHKFLGNTRSGLAASVAGEISRTETNRSSFSKPNNSYQVICSCLFENCVCTDSVFLWRIQQAKAAEDRAVEQRARHLQHSPGSRRAAAHSGSEQQPTASGPGDSLSSDWRYLVPDLFPKAFS